MITEEEISKALDYLRDEAKPDAKARAERLYMETWIKTVLAQESAKQSGVGVTAAEVQARISEPYIQALEAMRAAIYEDERRRFLRQAAEHKIEVYRTQEASNRALDRLHR